jgi:hypothetical protein
MAEPAFSWTDEDTETSAVTGYAGTEAEPGFPRVSTLLNLVQTVQDHASSDEEVVAVISHLLSTRRVRLGGIFAGKLIEVTA